MLELVRSVAVIGVGGWPVAGIGVPHLVRVAVAHPGPLEERLPQGFSDVRVRSPRLVLPRVMPDSAAGREGERFLWLERLERQR